MAVPAADPAEHIRLDKLGSWRDQIGKGGQAVVYDLPNLRLPDVAGPLVYKEYRPGHSPPAGLSRVVGLRNGLDVADRARLDELAAWPVRIVTDESSVKGVIMPRIPESFFEEVVLPGTGDTKKTVREVQLLFIDPARAKRLGRLTPSADERLAVCRDVAASLAFVHQLGIVFGDVNAKNVLFRLSAEPKAMLVDCDAVRIAGTAAVVAQLNAPDWEPPEGGPLSRATDLYKLGLLILRCLVPGNLGSLNRDPLTAVHALDATGIDLLTRALGRNVDQRPTAADWHLHLCRALGQPLDPPRLSTVDIDRTIVASGEPLLVTWSAEDATTVEVVAPGAPPVLVDGRPGSGAVRVFPAKAGRVEVSVRNDLGSDHLTTRPVVVLDLPATVALAVPIPQVTWPELAPDTNLSVDLPPLPRISDSLAVPLAAQALASPAQLAFAASPPPAVPQLFTEDLVRDLDLGSPGDILSMMTTPDPFHFDSQARGEVVR